jgi:hypothetical protein
MNDNQKPESRKQLIQARVKLLAIGSKGSDQVSSYYIPNSEPEVPDRSHGKVYNNNNLFDSSPGIVYSEIKSILSKSESDREYSCRTIYSRNSILK